MLGLGLRLLRPPTSPFFYTSISHKPVNVRSFIRLATQQSSLPFQSRQHRIALPLPLPVIKKAFFLGIRHASELSSVPPLHSIRQITQAEAEADADPNNVDAQLKLFRMLLESSRPAGRNVITSRWERMCEFNPTSPLLQSDEAFRYYLMALYDSGNSSSVAPAVQRREQLLRAHAPTAADLVDTEQDVPKVQTQAANLETKADTQTLASRSQLIAREVLSAGPLAPKRFSLFRRDGSNTMANGLRQSLHPITGGGGPESPLYVTIAEPGSDKFKRIFRAIVSAAFIIFIVMVVMSLLLEQTNLLKTGSRTSEFEPTEGKVVRFSDVQGVDEAKEELQEVVDFLKDPTNFTALGGKLPKGILLTGSPGTGKTMLARAVAGEAGVPFFFASGSEFEEIFVGVGAKRVRELFAAARKKQPAIIFIDELDAIGGKRSNRDASHLKQTLNQLLVEMDGFQQSENVIVIAATNFPESLDQALVRPGRFDRIIAVPLPDVRGRVQILQRHMRNVVSATDVDTMIIARGTPGFSGADLQNMVNMAAIQASKEGAKEVTLKHFEWAKDRILMGAERKTHYISPEDKKCTAYHEGGHALVALYTSGAMPLHKVTCVTRGHALGLTQFLPEDDKVSMSKKEYQASIDVSMGGRVAEEIIYGTENVSSGASSDIRNATSTASAMVRRFGFSDLVGPVFHHENDNTISPQRRELIESEIQRLIVEGERRAKNLLKDKETELHRLAEALVEYETLDLEEVKRVISGEKIRPVEEKLLEVLHQQTEPGHSSNSDPEEPSSPREEDAAVL